MAEHHADPFKGGEHMWEHDPEEYDAAELEEAYEETPPAPAVEDDEEYEPEDDDVYISRSKLARIRKLPKAERKEAYEVFKEKLLRQREGLAKLHIDMAALITKNPGIESEVLEQMVNKYAEWYELNYEQQQVVWDVLARFLNRRTDIEQALKGHPDAKSMFRFLFGMDPQGSPLLVRGPVSLGFICDDERDFALIHSGSYANRSEPTEEELKYAKKMQGCSVGSPERHLDGVIAVNRVATMQTKIQNAGRQEKKRIAEMPTKIQNADRQEYKMVLEHEEQHTLHRLFGRAGDETRRPFHYVFNKPPKSEAEARKQLTAFLRYRRSFAEAEVKDEILAYMRDGESPEGVLATLLKSVGKGEGYDFSGEWKNMTEKDMDTDHWHSAYRDLFPELAEKIFVEEYSNILKNGFGAFRTCRDVLRLSNNEAVALLEHQPLIYWRGTVARLEKRAKATEVSVGENTGIQDPGDKLVEDLYGNPDDEDPPKQRGMRRRKK